MLNITYDLTKELKNDSSCVCDVVWESSVDSLVFHSVDALKEQMHKDYFAEDYRIAQVGITFNDQTRVSFTYPSRIDIYALVGDLCIRVAKCEPMYFSDLFHTLQEYANYDL